MVPKQTWNKLLSELERVGNVYHACRKIGIEPSTYYRQRQKNKTFRKKADEVLLVGRANVGDIAEAKLLQQIDRGDTGAIKYALSHCHPLYRDRPRTEHSVEDAARARQEHWRHISESHRNMVELVDEVVDSGLLPPEGAEEAA